MSDFPGFSTLTRRDCALAIARFIAVFLTASFVLLTATGLALRLFDITPIHYGIITPTLIILSELSLLFATILATYLSMPRAWRSRSVVGQCAHLVPASSRHFVIGAVMGLLFIIVVIGLIVLCNSATLSALPPSWGTVALYIPAFLLVALTEELLIRGILLFWLKELCGFPTAATITSCIFGVLHIANGDPWPGIVSAALIGFFFCLTLNVTGTLWFAIGFHTLWDYGQSAIFGASDSGLPSVGALMEMRVSGPAWISGGSAGPEGSIFCIVLITGACWWLGSRTRGKNC